MTIALAAVALFGLTLLFAGLLGWAKEVLRVEEDPRIPAVNEVLPAANCGGCGYAGCSDFAKAVVEGRAECDGCPVGGAKTAEDIAAVLGVEVVKTFPYRPVIHCGAKTHEKLGRVPYHGVQTCAEAHVVGVTQACIYGCLGYGDCVTACTFDAIDMVDGSPVVNYEKCTGCGACGKACPRNLIENIPFKKAHMLAVACANTEPAKNVKQVCTAGCVGCKICQKMLGELFAVRNNLACLDYETYAGEEDLDALFKKCPANALVYFGGERPERAKDILAKKTADAEAAGATEG